VSETRRCPFCKEVKLLDGFGVVTSRGRRYHLRKCRTCSNESKRDSRRTSHGSALFLDNRLKRLYGITTNDYESLAERQQKVCAICKNPETARDCRTGRARRLSVDHCHSTGRIRKLLCIRCNFMVGQVENSHVPLWAVLAYLAEFKVDQPVSA
jgi:hypothetical protein